MHLGCSPVNLLGCLLCLRGSLASRLMHLEASLQSRLVCVHCSLLSLGSGPGSSLLDLSRCFCGRPLRVLGGLLCLCVEVVGKGLDVNLDITQNLQDMGAQVRMEGYTLFG